MRIRAKDHLGNEYETLVQMYNAYKNTPKIGRVITYSAFIKRLDAGWTIQECLEGKVRKGKQVVYQKTVYRSMRELCKAMDISASDFSRTIRRIGNVGETVSFCKRLKQIRQEEKEKKLKQFVENNNVSVNKKSQFELFKGEQCQKI